MTYDEREEIFCREVLDIADIQTLTKLSYQSAAKLIRDIKRRSDRLGIRGKIATQDYLDYMGIRVERYGRHQKTEPAKKQVKKTDEQETHMVPARKPAKPQPVLRLKDYEEDIKQNGSTRKQTVHKGQR